MNEAYKKGYENAVVLDPFGKVAEFASSNLFIVKDDVLFTPKDNGTYLAGITRKTIINLCKIHNIQIEEKDLNKDDLYSADEILSTGNYGKVMYIKKLDHLEFKCGKMFKKLNEIYIDYSKNFEI